MRANGQTRALIAEKVEPSAIARAEQRGRLMSIDDAVDLAARHLGAPSLG
jgi:hypothetical protein